MFRNKGSRRDSFGTTEFTTSYTTKQPEPQISSRSALLSSQGEAIEIPEFNDSLVVHKESTEIEHETVPPTHAELINDLVHIINQIDIDKVFVYDSLRSQTELVQHQLETHSDLAKPISSKLNTLNPLLIY